MSGENGTKTKKARRTARELAEHSASVAQKHARRFVLASNPALKEAESIVREAIEWGEANLRDIDETEPSRDTPLSDWQGACETLHAIVERRIAERMPK